MHAEIEAAQQRHTKRTRHFLAKMQEVEEKLKLLENLGAVSRALKEFAGKKP